MDKKIEIHSLGQRHVQLLLRSDHCQLGDFMARLVMSLNISNHSFRVLRWTEFYEKIHPTFTSANQKKVGIQMIFRSHSFVWQVLEPIWSSCILASNSDTPTPHRPVDGRASLKAKSPASGRHRNPWHGESTPRNQQKLYDLW